MTSLLLLVMLAQAEEPAPFVAERARSVGPAEFRKKSTFSFAASGGVSINDAFFTKVGPQLAARYYPKERIGFGLAGGWYATVTDEDTRLARANFQAVAVAVQPVWRAIAHVEWSPLYGKVAVGDSILYVDGWVTAGLGSVGVPRPGFAFELGAGGRLAFTRWLALTVGVTTTTYVAPPPGAQLGLLQNLTTFDLGLSFFLGGGS